MRVLAIGSMYPPQHLGGYELVWRAADEHLRAHGHDVRVLCSDLDLGAACPDPPWVYRELRWWWRDHAFPRQSLRARFAVERHNAAVIARHLAQQAPDAVAFWAMGGMSLSLLEHVRRAGVPAVAFVYDDWLLYGPRVDAWLRTFAHRPRLGALIERRTRLPTRVDLPDAARYVFGSESTRRRAGSFPKAAIAHLGIASAFLDAAPPRRDWTGRLLYVGRIDRRKGIETAVRALEHLPGSTTLAVVGDGDNAELQRLRGLAGPRVEFTGACERDALRDVYAAADAVLFPVEWEEPWGLVPLEAMGVGRPVLATGRGGSAEYLREGKNCLLFAPGDHAALAERVLRLAGDPGLRERLRAGGLRTGAAHTEARFNAEVQRLLLMCVERSGPDAESV